MRHGIALVFLALTASGCAMSERLPARIGLGEADILRLEGGDWERTTRDSNLGPTDRPVAVRRLRCWNDIGWTYRCSYDLDYGAAGNVAGSILTFNMYFGRDERGEWVRIIGVNPNERTNRE